MKQAPKVAAEHVGIMSVDGATCPSCAYTIERAGRRVAGVRDVRVDVSAHEIRVSYDGSREALKGVQAIVARLGYQTTVKDGEAPTG